MSPPLCPRCWLIWYIQGGPFPGELVQPRCSSSWSWALLSVSSMPLWPMTGICGHLFPLHYTLLMSRPICIKMVTVCWLISIAGALIYTVFTMRLPYCGPHKINHFFCEVPAVLKLACADTSLNDRWTSSWVSSAFDTTFLHPGLLYSHLCLLSILSIRSQGRLKSFSTCASHITVVTMFSWASHDHVHEAWVLVWPGEGQEAGPFLQCCSAFLNPIIYSLRNKDVKRAFLKVLGQRGQPNDPGCFRVVHNYTQFDEAHVVSWKYIRSGQHFWVFELPKKGDVTLKFSPLVGKFSATTTYRLSWGFKMKDLIYNK